jgi:hypothetical protein
LGRRHTAHTPHFRAKWRGIAAFVLVDLPHVSKRIDASAPRLSAIRACSPPARSSATRLVTAPVQRVSLLIRAVCR